MPFLCQDLSLDQTIAHIPLRTKAISQRAEALSRSPPCFMSSDVTIALIKKQDFPRLAQHWGKLRRVSPSEEVFAQVIACRLAIDAGEDEKISQWAAVWMQTSMEFVVTENAESFHKLHLKLRHLPGLQYEAVRLTALGQVLDFAAYRARLEPISDMEFFRQCHSSVICSIVMASILYLNLHDAVLRPVGL